MSGRVSERDRGGPSAEERLRETLDSLAGQVSPSPAAYARAHTEWRRRERRRRTQVIALASVIIAVADALGLWALNSARSGSPVVFDSPAPARVHTPAAPPEPPSP